MDNKNKFMKKFNELEKYLRIENKKDFSFESYKSAIYKSNNKVINNKYNKDTLVIAGNLRNIITHNEDVAFPTEKFVNNFNDLVSKIVSPKKALKVMTPFDKLLTASHKDNILLVIKQMKDKMFTNVPIIDERKVIGVFNETSLFQALLDENGELVVDLSKTSFKDYLNDFKVSMSNYFDYKFINQDLDIYKCYDLFINGNQDGKRVELLFVTKNGKESEKLLGIVSIFDIIGRL